MIEMKEQLNLIFMMWVVKLITFKIIIPRMNINCGSIYSQGSSENSKSSNNLQLGSLQLKLKPTKILSLKGTSNGKCRVTFIREGQRLPHREYSKLWSYNCNQCEHKIVEVFTLEITDVSYTSPKGLSSPYSSSGRLNHKERIEESLGETRPEMPINNLCSHCTQQLKPGLFIRNHTAKIHQVEHQTLTSAHPPIY